MNDANDSEAPTGGLRRVTAAEAHDLLRSGGAAVSYTHLTLPTTERV